MNQVAINHSKQPINLVIDPKAWEGLDPSKKEAINPPARCRTIKIEGGVKDVVTLTFECFATQRQLDALGIDNNKSDNQWMFVADAEEGL